MGFSSFKNVDVIQCNLKSDSILVIIDYSLGKNIYSLRSNPTGTGVAK